MKKILFVIAILFATNIFAQETKEEEVQPRNEVYLNAYNLITFKWLDISYEYLLDEESSVGISTLISLDKETYGYDSYRSFSLTPYYRHFFSNGYAKGFFVEAFTMVSSGDNDYYNGYYSEDVGEYVYDSKSENYTDLAFGVSLGGKFVSHKGFTAEIYGGIGRNLFDENAPEVVGRGGLSLGYRF